MTIPTNLIERALNLTGKTMEEMQTITPDGSNWGFSIENFCYFLLSEEFLTKQNVVIHGALHKFALAIYEYQRKDEEFPDGNPGPIISLLEKIPGQQKLT